MESVPLSTLTSEVCPTCHDQGTFFGPLPDRDYWQVQICPHCDKGKAIAAQQRERRIHKLFGEAKLPPKFGRASLEDFTDKPQLIREVKQCLASKSGVVLWGRRGTGKSHLAGAILRCKIAECVPSLFVYVPEMLGRMRDSFSGHGPSAYELLEGVKTIDFLVLDDLGKENATGWAREQLDIIINHRYSWNLQTVCTSNLNRKGLEAQIGDAAVSRLAEMCKWLAVRGRDRRLDFIEEVDRNANS
jgi:DNA replication protein DnaC